MTTVDERTLPHNLEAERSVLGAVLLHGDVLADIAGTLDERHFYRDAHRRLFRHMVALNDRGAPIELVTLRDALTRTGELEKVGGPAYIAALVDGVPRASNVDHYASIVREKAAYRDVIHTANQLLAQAYMASEPAHLMLDRAEQALFELAHAPTAGGFRSLGDIIADTIPLIEEWCRTQTGVTGVPTGFVAIDEMTCGLQPSELILLAARPSMGKTSLVLNIAESVALSGRTVGVFSLEMSESDLAVRELTGHAHVNSHELRRGTVGDWQLRRLGEAAAALSNARMHIDQSPYISAFDMRARARRLKAQHGLDLIVIDYLQLMAGHEKHDNRTLEIGSITRALKWLAKDLRIPVVALSQLSRAPDMREKDHRPRLSDLRESGSLEQDADVVMFLYREAQYDETPQNRNVAELIIGKQRNGPLGTVRLGWIPEETRFVDYSSAPQPEDQRLPIGDR